MWISKEGDVRKREFLDAALEVFTDKGYETATINDILAKVKVTKGSFYYYFKSKEDVLEALAEAQAESRIRVVENICDMPGAEALEKMNRIIREIYEVRARDAGALLKNQRMLINEENARLLNRIVDKMLARAGALYEKIIRQGVDEHSFDVAYPVEAAEMYLHLVNRLSDSIVRALAQGGAAADEAALKVKALFYEGLINGMLGAKNGMIELTGPVLRYVSAVKSIPFS